MVRSILARNLAKSQTLLGVITEDRKKVLAMNMATVLIGAVLI